MVTYSSPDLTTMTPVRKGEVDLTSRAPPISLVTVYISLADSSQNVFFKSPVMPEDNMGGLIITN